MSIQIRHANIDDLEQIAPLFDAYRQFYAQAPDIARARSFLAERFKNQQSTIFLATDANSQGVGFTQLYPSFSSVSASRIFILNDLFVVPGARRQGVAALLLKQAAQYGRAMGAIRLSLSTALDNAAAQKLYASLGWQRDNAFCHYDLSL